MVQPVKKLNNRNIVESSVKHHQTNKPMYLKSTILLLLKMVDINKELCLLNLRRSVLLVEETGRPGENH
jgi:hypothetical protein